MAASIAGGKTALANRIGMSKQFMQQIADGDRPVPAKWCIPIEDAIDGAITRYDLRPDIFGRKSDAA
ncbi:MAG: helix-turn-helix domain-containing protein [Halioglobus sp.]|nr:helix-turn-helix domain-containing protein [Halioglobus sp.]